MVRRTPPPSERGPRTRHACTNYGFIYFVSLIDDRTRTGRGTDPGSSTETRQTYIETYIQWSVSVPCTRDCPRCRAPRAPRRVLPVQVVVAVAQRILDPVQLAKAMHLAICSARLSRGGARGDAAVRGQCRAIIRLGYQLELHVHGIGIAARVAASSHNGRIATAIYAALAAHLDRQLLRPRRRLKCGWTAAAKHAAPYEQQGSHDEEEAGRSPQSSKEQRRAE